MRQVSIGSSRRLLTLAAVSVVAITSWQAAVGRMQDREALRAFMRPKLDHSKSVLEGVTTANFRLIAENARSLRSISENAQWRVNPDIIYVRYSTEFQRLATELERAAEAENLDSATLAYVSLTMNCVNCHKFVRSDRPAE